MTMALEPLRNAKPKQRIPQRVRRACEHLIEGRAKTVKDAAEQAGISREWLSRQLGKDHVIEYLNRRSRRELAVAQAKAAAVKVSLLDADSEHVRNDASSYVLALQGIEPIKHTTQDVNVTVTPGYVINLDGSRIAQTEALGGPDPLVIEHQPKDEQA